MLGPSVSGAMILFALSFDLAGGQEKTLPASYSVEEIETMYRKVDEIIESADPAKRAEQVQAFIESEKVRRGRRYEDSVIKVTSEKAFASMGTKVNFTTERKNLNFSIKPPFAGLLLKDYAREPIVEMKRGSPSRVEKHKAVADQKTGVVSFSLTLIEPNLSEKDVHVAYFAWALYKYSSKASLAAAEADLKPVREYADERLAGAEQLDRQALEERAGKQAEAAQDKRNEAETAGSESDYSVKSEPGVSRVDGVLMAVFGMGLAIISGVVVHRINRFGDAWFLRRERNRRDAA